MDSGCLLLDPSLHDGKFQYTTRKLFHITEKTYKNIYRYLGHDSLDPHLYIYYNRIDTDLRHFVR